MLQLFKQQLNYADVQDDLHSEFIQHVEPEDEDDILDEIDYRDENIFLEQDFEED